MGTLTHKQTKYVFEPQKARQWQDECKRKTFTEPCKCSTSADQSEKKRKKREVLLPHPDPRAPPKKCDVAAATMDEGIGKGGASPDQVVVIVEEGCEIEGAKSQEVLGGQSKGCCSVM